MRLIIHAGRSKTATSFLQTIFSLNDTHLESKNLVYPKLKSATEVAKKGLPTAGNAVYLALLLAGNVNLPDGMTRKKIFDDLTSACEKNDDKDILLSSELFEKMAESGLEDLIEFSKNTGRELFFVQYLRNPVDALEAIYAQGIKRHGLTQDPFNYVLSLNLWAFHYNSFLQMLQNRDIPVEVRHYDKERFVEGKIEIDFFDAIGITASTGELIYPPVSVNVSPSAYGLRVLRECNLISRGLSCYDANTKAVLKVDRALGLKPGVFSKEVKEYIIKHTQNQMEKLSENFKVDPFNYNEIKGYPQTDVEFEDYRFLYLIARR